MSTFISKLTSSEAHELIKNFFDGDETLIKTFDIVSEHMLGLDDQVILRGSEHVIGISKENEHYRFYVNKRERYSIKYKNWDKPEDFEPQNVEKYFSENIKCNEYFSKNPSECTIKKVSTKNKTNTNGRQSREEVLLELWKPIKEKVNKHSKLKDLIDIVEYVSENQKITKSGKNYNTKCPICGNEKTSVIFPETKSFYCFFCANGGDIITYVMKSKNVGYLDAIDILSNYAKIDFQKEERYSKSKLMRDAALYYHSQLRENRFAKTAVNVLHSWGISGKTIVQLGIGYHDKSSDCLKEHMVKKKSYTMEQLEDVFLVMKSQNGTYCDMMRDSIIIPTINSDSEVVGFDFYVIGQERLYRYPNTETFQRGENLYSYNLALKSNKKSVILVTNYEDYFYLVGKGINNVVSTYLPKITKEQFSLLKNKFKVIMILTNQNFNIAECRIFCNKNNVYCDAFDIPNEVSVKEYIDIHENEIKEKIETYDSL